METGDYILMYYIVKRVVLFFDEWFFYFTLYKLLRRGHRKILLPVMLYGISCIYTSYKNIDKIEREIVDVEQEVHICERLLKKIEWPTV